MHQYQDLIKVFNKCFLQAYNTQLLKGDSEPIYLPANQNVPYNTVYFAYGYFASALHECSHWLIAGAERRKLVDFGYWYEPDGRTPAQQALFLRVEVKPQALEWVLATASRFHFRISLDNLQGAAISDEHFKQAVYNQVKMYCEQGLPKRAELFRRALCEFYNTCPYLEINHFDYAIL